MSENPPYDELEQRVASLENQLDDYQWIEKQTLISICRYVQIK